MDVSYELYIKQDDRWILEGQFTGDQRQTAIGEAKILETEKDIQAVKVVREERDEGSGHVRDSTVYNSEKLKTGRLDRANLPAGGGLADTKVDVGGPDVADLEVVVGEGGPARVASGQKKKPARARGRGEEPAVLVRPAAMALYKMMIVLVASFGFAALMTFLYMRTVLGGFP